MGVDEAMIVAVWVATGGRVSMDVGMRVGIATSTGEEVVATDRPRNEHPWINSPHKRIQLTRMEFFMNVPL
jgi:hypothetical protein